MHYLKGLISSMQGHGQVNVPNITIECNPCSPAKKTRWCQTAATADKNRQEYSRQDSDLSPCPFNTPGER